MFIKKKDISPLKDSVIFTKETYPSKPRSSVAYTFCFYLLSQWSNLINFLLLSRNKFK